MSDTVENSTDPAGAVPDTNDACPKNMSANTVEINLNSSEMTQKHIKFFHKSSFACSLCDTPNDEKSRLLVQFCEIDYLSQLQNKNLRFNRKSAQSGNRREKSLSDSGKVGDGALNQNARQSGEPHLLEAASRQNATQSGEPHLLETDTIQNTRQSGEPHLLEAASIQNARQSGEPHLLEAATIQNARQSGEPHLLEAASRQNARQSGEPRLLEAASIQNARQSGEPHLLKATSSQNVRQSGEPHLLEAASSQNARQSGEPHLLEAASSQNARQSGEPHLLEAASLKSSVTEPTEADASASQPSKGPDNEVIGLVSELPNENDSELNGLVTFTEYGNSEWTSKELLMSPDTIIDEKGQIIEKNVNENRKKQSEDEDKVCEEAKEWKENDKCVAQWVEDGCWYRSVIEKIESSDKVLVKFIDYENSDFTSLSNIQPFETVIDVNGQIDNFRLNDNNAEVENKDGLNEEVEQWKEGDKCVAQWVEDGCWYRSVIEKIESSDKVLVKFSDYGNSDYTILSNLKHCDTIIGEDGQIINIEINEKNVEKGNQVSAIDTGEDKPVHKVEEVDLIGGTENFWKEGDACVAQWKEDDLWYRSVITKIESNDKVLVTFTDYGNSEYTSLEALKPAETRIQEDGPIEEVNDGNDVAWKVDDECVAQWEEDKYWYRSKIVTIDSNENVLVEFTEYGNTDYTTLAKLKPFNTEIVNGQLKVATEANEKDIDESEEKSKTNEKCLWKKGDICLAQWSGDQCWYKSVIVLIENDGLTLVKFIEYGNLDYTTLSNLRTFQTKTSVCGQAESHDTSVDQDEKALDSTAQDGQATSDCLQMETGKADSAALTTNDVSSKWKVGDSCVAQWRLDGYWYKSIITKLKSSGKVKVLFTEYGNSDYTSIDLLKPPETVIGVDGTLADETSSGVIHNKSMKLEPIVEEPLEGDAFKGNGNEEEQKMSEGTILIAVTNNKEKETCCGTGTLETKVSVEAIEISVDISNNNVDTMRKENDQKDLVEPKNQGEMLVPNTEHDHNGVVVTEIETNTPTQSSLMNTDTLLLESITEINSSELINEIEIKNKSETTCESYPAVSPNESMSKSFDGETRNELLISTAGENTTKSMSEIDAAETNHTRSPDECNFTVTSKTKMDFVNHLTKNTIEVTSVNENQTDENASFGLMDSLLKKSDAGDDESGSAPESLANNSESIFHGKVRSLAMHEEGSKYLVAVTNQDTVVKIQEELMTVPLSVMLHPVASKVMQSVIDVTDNLEELLEIVLENFYTLSSDKDGSKTIQKILTRLPCAQKSDIVAKLENEEVLKNLLSSQHGTNVAQACLPYLTEGSVTCVGNYLLGNIVELGSSPNGSYFLQLFMTSSNPTIIKVFKDKVLDAIVENADLLVKDKFGTWLAQTGAKVISSPRHILLFSAWVKDNIMDVYCDPDAMHFASSVIEALVKISNSEETDFDVNSSKRESEKILREVIFLMTDTLVEVNGGSVPLIVASSIDPYGHVLAREVCLQARYVPEIRNKFSQVFSQYKSKLEDDTFGCLVLKGLQGLL